jgi:glycosyltransferase involved in cell wall biosynthesis
VHLGTFARVTHQAADGPLRLLFVGGDFVRKGGQELLAAVARLGPGFELDIVSNDEVEGAATGRLPRGVRVHRGLTHQSAELFELYRRADVFVLPTRADTLGLVFAEALAAGVPVIACDVGGVREIVVPGETGLLVPPRDVDALVAAVRTLADDPALRQRLGGRGRELVLRDHDADRNCRRILDLLVELAEAPSARTAA